MKPKYVIGQCVEYVARNKCTYNGNVINGKWSHFVGFVKIVRRRLFGFAYVINVAKSRDVHIVPERDIIGIPKNKPNKEI